MNWAIWFQAFLPELIGMLRNGGNNERADFWEKALIGLRARKNMDDIMQAYADKWEAEGEPSIESINADTKAIQARIGG